MTRVLYVTYYFPPTGGAGVQRAVKFARYLPEFGVVPVILTGPLGSGRGLPPDDSLAAEVPAEVEVLRVGGPEPASTAADSRAERWLRRPSRWTRWWPEGIVARGRRLEGIDLLFCSMSPFASAAGAARLAAELDVPWVADLRDPWALDEMMVYPTRLHRALEERAMRRALASASAIVMNTPEAAAQLTRSFPELREIPVAAIPNGFDAADFEAAPPVRHDDAFRIVHVGVLHTEQGRRHRHSARLRRVLGGTLADVDILPRSHVYLLEAAKRLERQPPDPASPIEIHLGGALSPADLAVTANEKLVRTPGYLPHAEAVALVRSADLLFLPMHDLAPGRRARIVPGKTYEYIASGRPILAAVPDGDARDLLVAAGTAHVCRPTDVEAMSEAILREIDRKQRGAAPPAPPAEILRRFERRELARRLSELLRTVAAGGAIDARSAAAD